MTAPGHFNNGFHWERLFCPLMNGYIGNAECIQRNCPHREECLTNENNKHRNPFKDTMSDVIGTVIDRAHISPGYPYNPTQG